MRMLDSIVFQIEKEKRREQQEIRFQERQKAYKNQKSKSGGNK